MYDLVLGSLFISEVLFSNFRRTASTSEGKVYAKHDNYVTIVVYAKPTETFPNGLILTGSNDNLIRAFFEDESDPVFVLYGHTDTGLFELNSWFYPLVCTLDSNIDGLIASGSWDSTARLWNYDTCIGKLQRKPFWPFGFRFNFVLNLLG